MPTIEQNNELWDDKYEWPEQGDEWSRVWGGASSQWFGTLLPRLRSFVPAPTILEIAPGFGRWTQFLRPLCSQLILVDVSPKCIAACQRRFAGDDGIQYHVNDGKSLAMVADGSVDFAFSFDSLVHVEAPVLNGYLEQLARKLAPNGVAFLHHSNIGAFVNPATGELVDGMVNRHWRAPSVSAELVRQTCDRNALVCLSQEIVNWGGHDLTDALSVVTRTESKWSSRTVVLLNHDFMREAEYLARLASLYDWNSLGRGAGEGNKDTE
jgi:SAM-dependent methyltransferase